MAILASHPELGVVAAAMNHFPKSRYIVQFRVPMGSLSIPALHVHLMPRPTTAHVHPETSRRDQLLGLVRYVSIVTPCFEMLDDLQYSVVFAFVRIGFEGLGSYGPKSSFDRAMVSM